MSDRAAPLDEIRALVASNPKQLHFEEYVAVWDEIARRAPCRLLVFGCGRDSAFWVRANRGGRTLFIEHNRKWARHAARNLTALANHDACEIRRVRYWTRLWQWRALLDRTWLLRLRAIEPGWDVVFVDAPPGKGRRAPGRMRSIYTASVVARADATVLVHDMNREVEQAYAARYLGPASVRVERLGVWRAPRSLAT